MSNSQRSTTPPPTNQEMVCPGAPGRPRRTNASMQTPIIRPIPIRWLLQSLNNVLPNPPPAPKKRKREVGDRVPNCKTARMQMKYEQQIREAGFEMDMKAYLNAQVQASLRASLQAALQAALQATLQS